MQDIQENEEERIKDLEAYRIMDTPREMSFDQIAYLASMVCETPIAIISFIDSQRQWFKSAIGIDLKEIPKTLSLCLHTQGTVGILEIEDLSKAEQCEEYRVALQKNLRFYAGIPLVSPHGHFLGTLCVFDHWPRKLTDHQRQTLIILASQVMDEVEVRRIYRENLLEFESMMSAKQKLELKHHKLVHTHRMNALAEMAAGVGFQISDPLSLISGCIKTLHHISENYEINPSLLSMELSVIEANLQRMHEFMKSLKLFTLEGEEWRKPLDLNHLIEDVILSLGKKFAREKVKINFNKIEEFFLVGNPHQIAETLHCLLTNSLDAVGQMKTGTINVEVKKEKNFAVIRVMDNGIGVDEVIKDFIFQPFFSTKSEGKTGDLCLCLAKMYMALHMGELLLEKIQGPTTFLIKLPIPVSN